MALSWCFEETRFTERFLILRITTDWKIEGKNTLLRTPGSMSLDSNMKIFIGGITSAQKCSAHSALN